MRNITLTLCIASVTMLSCNDKSKDNPSPADSTAQAGQSEMKKDGGAITMA